MYNPRYHAVTATGATQRVEPLRLAGSERTLVRKVVIERNDRPPSGATEPEVRHVLNVPAIRGQVRRGPAR
jgi:hypothetical protein